MSEENKNEQLDTFLTEIGDAIREVKGTTGLINARNMAGIVRGMSSGEDLTTELSEYDELNSELEDVIDSLPDAGSGGGPDMLQARIDATNSCEYLFYYYTGDNVDYINNLDTSSVTTMQDMFHNCKNITTIPALDTSNVTNMSSMFYNCTNLTTVPNLDTSNVTNMSSMFHFCTNLTTVPNLDTSNVTSMSNMFYSCENITTIPELDTSNVTTMNRMFSSCENLTTIPELDTSNVTNMNNMFSDCTNLTTVPNLDTSNVTDMRSMFYGCTNLKSIYMTGMKVAFDISKSTKFARTDLVTILNNLATVTSTTKLTMGSTNLAKLTTADKAIATNKGWTLA